MLPSGIHCAEDSPCFSEDGVKVSWRAVFCCTSMSQMCVFAPSAVASAICTRTLRPSGETRGSESERTWRKSSLEGKWLSSAACASESEVRQTASNVQLENFRIAEGYRRV